MVNDPKIILADEPTGNLDQAAGKQIMELFRELNDAGSTIILITHDLKLASQASRMVYIDDGHLSSSMAATHPIGVDKAVPTGRQPLQQGISP